MPKCPHCGEFVSAGQETCFACGQKIRRRRQKQGITTRTVLYAAGGFVLVLAVVFIMIGVGSANKRRTAAKKQEMARVQDSVRKANRAREDTVKVVQAQSKEQQEFIDDLDKQEERLRTVVRDVVGARPSDEQARLMGRAQTELNRLRQVTATLSLATKKEDRDRIKVDIRDGSRQLRSLISDLGRVPKAKPDSAKQQTGSARGAAGK